MKAAHRNPTRSNSIELRRRTRARVVRGLLRFYVISVNGETYLASAHSRMRAIELFANTMGIGTDQADWTELMDSMFSEVRPDSLSPALCPSRKRFLILCENQSVFMGRVTIGRESSPTARTMPATAIGM